MKIKDNRREEIVSDFFEGFFVCFFFKPRLDGRLFFISISHHATNLQKAVERCGGRTSEINEKQKIRPKKKKKKKTC